MKKTSFRILSLVMVLILAMSSVVFAADETVDDVVITSSAASMTGYYFTNYKSGEISSNITPRNFYDVVADDTVRRFSTDAYYSGNSRGSEPRFYLVDPKTTEAVALGEGLADFTKYDYLRIAFDIYIGDTDDGIAFRMQRFGSDGVIDTNLDYYICIGGSAFSSGTVTNGYRYMDKSLTAGKWHNVVMELGSVKSDVKFYIDNELSESTVMNKIESKNSTDDVISGFPEGTYGFGGKANTCVMIIKGKNSSTTNGDCPLDVRLDNFSMVATNTAYTAPEDVVPMNTLVYEMTSESSFIKKVNLEIAKEEKTAPHIADKKAIHHSFELFQSANTPGNESGYNTLTSKGGFVGGLDYSKYDNLRISFNINIGNSTNGVYFRARRSPDGGTTWNSDNYIFNIGGADFKHGAPGSGTPYTYFYDALEPDRWHNVVMELGANPGNTDVKYYVDGELVVDSVGTLANDVYGYGGGNANWAIFAMSTTKDTDLDLYISDLKMVASNTKHNPDIVPAPSVSADAAVAGITDDKIFTAEGATADILTPVSADYVYMLDGEKLVVAYNDASKKVKYYDLTKGGFNVENTDISFVDGELSVAADIFNFTGNALTPYAALAAYKYDENEHPMVVGVSLVKDVTYENGSGSFSQSVAVDDYDYLKVMFMNENLSPVTEAFSTDKEPVDILVIGCSFSGDSTKYVHQIAESMGVEVNVHHYGHSGGSVSSHLAAIDSAKTLDRNADDWYYTLNGGEQKYNTINPGVTNPTLKTFIEENEFDAVILQNYWSTSEQIAEYAQPEGYTPETDENGKEYRTYYASPYYVELAEFVKERQPNAKIIINSVWSNEQGYNMSNHVKNNYEAEGFENASAYMYDLLEKYNGQSATDIGATILSNGTTIGKDGGAVAQLPAGYAIQYARNWKDENGDNIFFTVKNPDDYKGWEADVLYPAPVYEGKIRLMRDGFHLSPAGRYLVGCVWAEILTGRDVRNATFKPGYDDSFKTQALDENGNTVAGKARYYYDEMDDNTAALIKQLAHEAIAKFNSQDTRCLDDASLEF